MAIHDHHSMGLVSQRADGPLGPFEYIKIAFEQGGRWETFLVHCIEMPNGDRWDAMHGWDTHQDNSAVTHTSKWEKLTWHSKAATHS